MTRVDPNALLERESSGAGRQVGEWDHTLLHLQGGVDGAHGIIFVGDGRAKQGYDAVAHSVGINLVHDAAVFVDHAAHGRKVPVQDLYEFLSPVGGHSRDDLVDPIEVGEKDRYLPVLPFEHPLSRRGDDPLQELGGQVGGQGLQPLDEPVQARGHLWQGSARFPGGRQR